MDKTNPLQSVLALLKGVRQSGPEQFEARCPAHDDRRASLSIGRGRDGRVLLHCHAGCTPQAVCGALDLRLSDLMPPKTARTVPRGDARRPAPPGPQAAKAARVYALPCLAAKALAKSTGGKLAGWWPYFRADDGKALTVLRFDLPDDDKTYRPIRPSGGGWSVGDPPGLLPLYRLAALNGAARVCVVEGEKCAEAAAGIGLAATTSAHGAKSAAKTDWTPLAGRDVVILPDKDGNGEDYAADVARILAGLTPPATVRIVRLPDLPPKGDIVDFLDARDAQAPEDLRRAIEALADAAPPLTPAARPQGGQPQAEGSPGEKRGGLFIPAVVLNYRGVSAGDRIVWAKLLAYASKSGDAYAGVSRYATETGLAERAVWRHLRRLEKKGLIWPKGGPAGGRGKTVHYEVSRP